MMSIQWKNPEITDPTSAILAAPGTVLPEKPVAGRGIDGTGAILPAPSAEPCDIGAELAILGIRAGRDEQQINQDAEQTANEVEIDAERAEVSEMHQEASDIMSSAALTCCLQVEQGLTQIAGAGAPQSQQIGYQGTATLFGAGATLSTASGQAQQQMDQAMITASKAVADSAGQTATSARQAETDAQSVIQNAIQFYQQYQQSKAQLDLVAAGQKA